MTRADEPLQSLHLRTAAAEACNEQNHTEGSSGGADDDANSGDGHLLPYWGERGRGDVVCTIDLSSGKEQVRGL